LGEDICPRRGWPAGSAGESAAEDVGAWRRWRRSADGNRLRGVLGEPLAPARAGRAKSEKHFEFASRLASQPAWAARAQRHRAGWSACGGAGCQNAREAPCKSRGMGRRLPAP
jgi:hypothetical protein